MNDQKLINRIELRLLNAEHILTQTYPLIKDPKILIGVLENIYYAINDIITCMLEERNQNLSDEEKFEIFKIKYSKYTEFVKEIKTLWKNKKECPIEFVKNEKLHLCSNEYEIRIISENEMKRYLSNAKLLSKQIRG